ncbi:Multiprotein-bridging factor 1a [Hibiscus syriacus]|uniref:Multiprotein-bridging factor 1a n=1 Tax=Hibiscus syriacus TaxID=106335 RepID=A0A6A2W8G4_HIBSY|nr:Multiprotein-bridging factor 1a [Hibiscus syriacus]
MAGTGPLTQDWEPIVIRKKAPSAALKKDEKVTRKLDEDTENLAHERVPTELKKAIMQARMDKKLTQAQLAQMINEKPQIIQEYESGKAIPNQQIIGKLERLLGQSCEVKSESVLLKERTT